MIMQREDWRSYQKPIYVERRIYVGDSMSMDMKGSRHFRLLLRKGFTCVFKKKRSYFYKKKQIRIFFST